jgi:hypothetical protein
VAKTVTGLSTTGKVVTGKAPKRAKEVELPITIVDTKLKRFWRNAVG